MTEETIAIPDQVVVQPEDRTMPAVTYALYLLGLASGVTILIGLVIAYAKRSEAAPKMRSHYTFAIRTFWLGIAWFLIGGALVLFGIPLSLLLIGIPIVAVGALICSVVWIWFAVRAVVGVVYLARGEAYPRPESWIV